jgi:cytosine/adenosine deaminase-related metal-dependent hydrolase
MRLLIKAGNRHVAVSGGEIVANGEPFDLILEMPNTEIRPGLINAHDHLHRNHYGRLGRPPYRNAPQWAADIQVRHRDQIAAGRRRPRREALEVGAWKNLFAGVTSVVHHDAWETVFEQDFPLGVLKIPNADSVSMSRDLNDLRGEGPFCLHLSEGVDRVAADEVRRLELLGLLNDRLIAVHGLGMDASGAAAFRASGAALVWCPSSNLFLFGRTVGEPLLREGVDVLLGSDSRLTGEGDLLDEIRCARSLGLLSDARLEDAVGATAARRLGAPEPTLAPGAPADLVVLTKPLLEARATDVALVLVGGVVRVARPDVAAILGSVASSGKEMRVGEITRWTNLNPVCPSLARSFP